MLKLKLKLFPAALAALLVLGVPTSSLRADPPPDDATPAPPQGGERPAEDTDKIIKEVEELYQFPAVKGMNTFKAEMLDLPHRQALDYSTGSTKLLSPADHKFDMALQDDSNPRTVVLVNSFTGDYKFPLGGAVINKIPPPKGGSIQPPESGQILLNRDVGADQFLRTGSDLPMPPTGANPNPSDAGAPAQSPPGGWIPLLDPLIDTGAVAAGSGAGGGSSPSGSSDSSVSSGAGSGSSSGSGPLATH